MEHIRRLKPKQGTRDGMIEHVDRAAFSQKTLEIPSDQQKAFYTEAEPSRLEVFNRHARTLPNIENVKVTGRRSLAKFMQGVRSDLASQLKAEMIDEDYYKVQMDYANAVEREVMRLRHQVPQRKLLQFSVFQLPPGAAKDSKHETGYRGADRMHIDRGSGQISDPSPTDVAVVATSRGPSVQYETTGSITALPPRSLSVHSGDTTHRSPQGAGNLGRTTVALEFGKKRTLKRN